MNELHLFAGAGGGILASQLLGDRCVCAVEWEPYAQAVLVARQNDGTFPPFPIWNDVQTFDGKPWRGIVDIVAGGFPCQDISAAGAGAGIDGERSGMWGQMARIIGEVRPRFVRVENSPMLTSRGLGRVLGDLAEMGFDAEWGVVSAADTGAPHLRERIWIMGNSNGIDGQKSSRQPAKERNSNNEARALPFPSRAGGVSPVADASGQHEQGQFSGIADEKGRAGSQQRQARPRGYGFGRWPAEPGLGRVANGMAYRSHRLKAIGNGQVPRVAAAAFSLLNK